MKKYELTDETLKIGAITLHRIKAVVAFADASAGETGGWVEKEENLDQAGAAWVSGDAMVYGDARVFGDARVSGDARVFGDAMVFGDASVSGDAMVFGDARVFGDAWVSGDAMVSGDARVFGDAWVSGDASVSGDAMVFGDARVFGDAWVSGDAMVFGDASHLEIGPIGSRDDTITFTRDKKGGIYAAIGCFFGTLAEFREKVGKTHGENVHAQAYLLAAQLAELRIDTTPVDDGQEQLEKETENDEK